MLTRIFCLLLALLPLLPLSTSAQQASWQLKNISNATLPFETLTPRVAHGNNSRFIRIKPSTTP